MRIVFPLLLLLGLCKCELCAQSPLDFSREILPILSENCFACHGPDVADRKSDLRLDTRDGLLASVALQSPSQSELLERIQTGDLDRLMPPPSSRKKRLTERQIETMRIWLEAGAPWEKHWALQPPKKIEIPMGGGDHPIDALVSMRLEKEGLELAPKADSATLHRRLAFDLTGLPPTDSDEQQSLAARIDRWLESPHYGERMAMWWLDLARYSDTDGFQADATRTNWPWRDWVVQAFNQNMGYDQFTIEQFAGDLLPDSTDEQKLATCFHRNHMTNGEGGRDPEESRVDYVIDRVNTMGTVWLGMTLGCCQCHSHKFDPISQAEYYSLSAFFNSIDEDGKAGGGAKPSLSYKSPYAARAVEESERIVQQRKPIVETVQRDSETEFARWLNQRKDAVRNGYSAWQPIQASTVQSSEGTKLSQESDGAIQASGLHPNQDDYRVSARVAAPRVTGLKLEVLPHPSHTGGGLSRGKSGEFILTDIKVQVQAHGSSQVRDIVLRSAIADYSADKKANENYGDVKDTLDDDPRNGWTTKGSCNTQAHSAVYALAEPLILESNEEIVVELRQRSTLGDANIGRFRLSICSEAGEAVRSLNRTPLDELQSIVNGKELELSSELRSRLFSQFLEDHEPFQAVKRRLDQAEKQLDEVRKAAEKLNVMVLADRAEARDTFVLQRGVWDKHGQCVQPGVPAAISPWNEGESPNRLGLARWVVSRSNPLTARVFVNHLWQLFFGQGLVRTQEDFGLQGEAPTHPALLDWLAVEFMESGWDVKHLVRLIVTSRTYQQSSNVSAELLTRDPDNRLLARGARFRLPAWMLRDAALNASGLLNPAIGGPPVRPYQPAGVWEEMFMGRFTYEPSVGDAQYRRSLYAFWRRAIAPTFLFDSAQRRTCEVRPPRTNTPLHALTLLNDQTYLESSLALATRVCEERQDPDEQVRSIYRRILSREPTGDELQVLLGERQQALNHYAHSPADCQKLLSSIGGNNSPHQSPVQPDQLAAMTLVASMVFNLDEAITHE